MRSSKTVFKCSDRFESFWLLCKILAHKTRTQPAVIVSNLLSSFRTFGTWCLTNLAIIVIHLFLSFSSRSYYLWQVTPLSLSDMALMCPWELNWSQPECVDWGSARIPVGGHSQTTHTTSYYPYLYLSIIHWPCHCSLTATSFTVYGSIQMPIKVIYQLVLCWSLRSQWEVKWIIKTWFKISS